MSEPGARPACFRVPVIGRGKSGRPEDRDGRSVDPGNRLEPTPELLGDELDVSSVILRRSLKERPFVHIVPSLGCGLMPYGPRIKHLSLAHGAQSGGYQVAK
jgi:hypothetical protein